MSHASEGLGNRPSSVEDQKCYICEGGGRSVSAESGIKVIKIVMSSSRQTHP